MGFRSGAYATIWSVEPVSDVNTKCRISISRKNKQSGEYEDDFSGFVSFYGTVAAKQAAGLKERDRIKLGDVDVRTRYVREKNTTYYNFSCFSFEKQDRASGDGSSGDFSYAGGADQSVDDGEMDSRLPF